MEDDHEELLQASDDESLSETEDHCCPVEKREQHFLYPLSFFPQTKLDFFANLVLLILSSTALLIVLPLYVDTINSKGNIYSVVLFNVPLSTLIFIVILLAMKFLSRQFANQNFLKLPISLWPLVQLTCLYTSCVYLYLYGVDRNRVLCHLQDPIKGIILVLALLYYFFFCRNLMGLHRIFSTTTVIVGLFITVDYGLCDEFVCRGYERQAVSDDAGPWPWKTHTAWTGLYILSLILFAAFYTVLDRYVAPEFQIMPTNIVSPALLNTISSSIGTPSGSNECERQTVSEVVIKKSAVHFATWIHVFVSVLVLLTFWVDLIPGVGKGSTPMESLNFTLNGFACHFTNQEHVAPHSDSCRLVLWYAVAFQVSYVLFTISSIKLLILTQSAVVTIAAMSFALPVIGIWWSMFQATPTGDLVWSPKLRGEFICCIVGCPIVSVGLGLLCKAHFEDLRRPRNNMLPACSFRS